MLATCECVCVCVFDSIFYLRKTTAESRAHSKVTSSLRPIKSFHMFVGLSAAACQVL